MDWALAIDRNREALLRLLAVLFATVGLTQGGGPVVSLPGHVHRAVLRLLRPAESAARRLIVIAAHVSAIRGMSLVRRQAHPCPRSIPRGTGARIPCFPLLDSLKRLPGAGPLRPTGPEPRLSVPGFDDPVFAPDTMPSPENLIGAERLCRRLHSLQRALDDLPGQARRLARWTARRAQSSGPGRVSPLRPGWPPGYRKRPIHEVDTILEDCHALAHHALCQANAPILKPG